MPDVYMCYCNKGKKTAEDNVYIDIKASNKGIKASNLKYEVTERLGTGILRRCSPRPHRKP